MNVAILNRQPAPIGGDHVKLRYLIPALQSKGVGVAKLWGENLAEQLKDFDLAHVYHVNFHFCRENFAAVKAAGIPYVVTPVYYREYAEMTRTEQGSALAGAKCVFPFSRAELSEMLEDLPGPLCPAVVVPNATDELFHADPWTDRIGVCSSDWGGTKGCDVLASACQSLGIPFERFSNVPHEQMPEAYRRFRLYASASRSDRMSLSVGEALCAGCRVLSSSANRGNEHYPGLVVVDKDASAEEWARRIDAAYHAPAWDWTPNEAARKLTWGWVAGRLIEVYRSVLA